MRFGRLNCSKSRCCATRRPAGHAPDDTSSQPLQLGEALDQRADLVAENLAGQALPKSVSRHEHLLEVEAQVNLARIALSA